jgi:hypothetical protein
MKTLPAPLEVITHKGFAIVGVCLIALTQLRLKGFPAAVGMWSENMAHRVAVRYPTAEGMRDGVFVWRRETDQPSITLLRVRTKDREADVSFDGTWTDDWQPTPAFLGRAEVSEFFRRGDCGYSCSRRGGRLDGLQFTTLATTPIRRV